MASFNMMDIDNNNMIMPRLHLYIDCNDDELFKKYEQKIENHNNMINDNIYPDSGFDLLIPEEDSGIIRGNQRKKIDYKVICTMEGNNNTFIPFYIYPRSSISKTPLQMCNNVGIIDSGYRGHLMSYFANHNTIIENSIETSSEYMIEPYSRLTQICHPTLQPFYVVLENNRDFFENTERGDGGFGSTGN